MTTLSRNITVARMAGIARTYGNTRGMLACSIDTDDQAKALFAMTHGYVLVILNGENHTSAWMHEKPVAIDLWHWLNTDSVTAGKDPA